MFDPERHQQEQHKRAHELAEELQQTIERYQADNDMLPASILYALMITAVGWQSFCQSLGMSEEGVQLLVRNAMGCSEELREYLQLYAPRFVEYLNRVQDEEENGVH
jgi:hypothetical protein